MNNTETIHLLLHVVLPTTTTLNPLLFLFFMFKNATQRLHFILLKTFKAKSNFLDLAKRTSIVSVNTYFRFVVFTYQTCFIGSTKLGTVLKKSIANFWQQQFIWDYQSVWLEEFGNWYDAHIAIDPNFELSDSCGRNPPVSVSVTNDLLLELE